MTSRWRRHVPPLLRDRQFRLFWTGQSVSMFGDQVSSLAVPLLAVLVLHADAGQMGLLTAIGLALGGNARAGLEDALYLRKGELSPGNLPLVQRAVNLAAALDRPTASVAETTALLRLPPPH